jgi:23S rRNA pseudouridine955/2504/2580 synthase
VLLKLFSHREVWELPVLYEDQHLLALDKPAGLFTVADSEDPDRPNLLGLLHGGIADAKPWARERALSFLMNPYRLDPEASGIVLLAKSKGVLARLSDLFGSEQPSLSFMSLVKGSPSEGRFSVDAKLAPHPVRVGLMGVNAKLGKRARTDFEVIERFAGWTLLKCVPLTHRPHQVRVHLAHAGFPLAGDQAYGGKPLLLSRLKHGYHLKPKHTERPLIDSPCLHAEQLDLDHPATGNRLVINAPWPKDLMVAVKYLRRYAAIL